MSQEPAVPPEVDAELRVIGRYTGLRVNIERARDRAFTLEERRSGKLPWTFSELCDYWSRTREVSRPVAFVELAYRAEMILKPAYDRLMGALGSGKVPRTRRLKPRFHDDGLLTFGEKTIGSFRIQASATRQVRILRAFEDAKWARKVASPLGKDKEALRTALSYMNKRLDGIVLSVHEDGRSMSWRESS
jgi:hypothetical protein